MKLLLIILLMFSNQAFTATQAVLILSGFVPTNVSLSIVGATPTLDLSTTAVDSSVGTLHAEGNSGYQILLSSANSGSLVNGSGNVAYSLKVDGSSIGLTLASQVIISQSAGLNNDDYSMEVSYTGQNLSTLPSGTYTDTLTFTIQGL